MPVQCTCRHCGASFSVLPSLGHRQYCAAACYHAARVRSVDGPWLCIRCETRQPPEAFPLHGNGRRDRFCKACHAARIRARYAADPSYAAIYRRAALAYAAKYPARKNAADAAYHRRRRDVNREAVGGYQRRHPERAAAHRAVKAALAAGRLERKPCRDCGATNSHGHHHLGYAAEHRLDVIWLCPPHHRRAHPRNALN